MQSANFKNHLHLHFLVLIAGFTAILGELITIKAVSLVWYRMVFAFVFMGVYLKITKVRLKIKPKALLRFSIAGIIIALHWITFFGAIDHANISIALAMFSTGAFFAALIEPIVYKRAFIWYEIVFGLVVVIGVFIITQSEIKYLTGIVLGISSAFFSSLFAVLNGSFLKHDAPQVISFYEFLSGLLFTSLYLVLFDNGFSKPFFNISLSDFSYLLVLASICTAYAFVAAVNIMKVISPYSVVLTYNLEPVYGIVLAVILFPEKEKMSLSFYGGAFAIISVVLLNSLVRRERKPKRNQT